MSFLNRVNKPSDVATYGYCCYKQEVIFIFIEKVYDVNNLLDGCERIKRASGWKESTQKFYINKLKYAVEMHHKIENGIYEQSGGYEFLLNERGRSRLIKALSCTDMMVQHSLCDNVLVPEVRKYLIHDSGASLKGKGLSFTRKRFEQHIHSYYRKYGREGYVLLIDFRKFFDNIQHEKLLGIYEKIFLEKEFIEFLASILKSYEIDTDGTMEDVYNAVEDSGGKNHLRKSMGIGAPLSQITGLIYPLAIDTYCKTVKGLKYYGAYADDRYVIYHDKGYLKQLLKEIEIEANKLGIHIHKDKTQIIKLSHGFTFLKTRYILTETGKLIKKIPKDVVTRQRRKIKKLSKKLSRKDFENWYKSWCGDKVKYNAYSTLRELDEVKEKCINFGIIMKKNV